MKRRAGLQEEDDEVDEIKIKRLISPRLLPSTATAKENCLTTTTISTIENVDEETTTTTTTTTTTKIKTATATIGLVGFVDANDDLNNKIGLAAATETVQKDVNQDNKVMHRNMLQECEEGISGIDENSIASHDNSISAHPGAFAIQGPRFDTYNTTTEDETVQCSTGRGEVEIATETHEEENNAEKIKVNDPLEAERVLEIVQGTSVTLDQNDSSTQWKQLTIILGIFFFILFSVAAVLITFFVRSNRNGINESLPPPKSTSPPVVATIASTSPTYLPTFGPSMIPSAAPTSVQQQITTLLYVFFPDLPASNDQEQALGWIFTDPTSLGVMIDEGMTSENKKLVILERFILATIYFATNGVGWRHNDLWLSPLFVCQWYGITCPIHATVEQSEVNEIDLGNNRLTGSIPTGVGLMTSLTLLDLFNNVLTGTIPSEVGLMTNLGYLRISNNMLTGPIPTEVGLFTSMMWLFLHDNALTGSIPTEVGLMTNMLNIWLPVNALSGSIPTEVGLLTSMTRLLLSSNALTGPIPTGVGLMTNMDLLLLAQNNLNGSIPTELGLMNSLNRLDLSKNSLTGSIPTEVGSMASMAWLQLYNNSLTGSIPSEVALITRMMELSLSNNTLIGSIPTEVGLMTTMRNLFLENNLLVGSIPTEVGLLTRLTGFSLSGNSNLTGNIPSEVVSILPNVISCYMGNTSLIDVPENCQGSV